MKKFYLSRTDRKIAGVCGGLGELMNVDPTIVRLAMVILCLATVVFPFLVGYILAWIIVPRSPS